MNKLSTLNWKIAGQTAAMKVQEQEGKPKSQKADFKLDLAAMKQKREDIREAVGNRVLYARKAGEEFGQHVDDGEKISQETACSLKHFAWGSANMPPKSEWLKQGIPLHPAEGLFAYGVRAPRNGTRNFLLCLNAYFLKHLLFDTGKSRNKASK